MILFLDFRYGDLGLDIGLVVAKTLREKFQRFPVAAIPNFRKLVASGDPGRKTGKGWYDYSGGEK